MEKNIFNIINKINKFLFLNSEQIKTDELKIFNNVPHFLKVDVSRVSRKVRL